MADELEIVTRGPTLPELWTTFVLTKGKLADMSQRGYAAVGRKLCLFMAGRQLDEHSLNEFRIWRVNQNSKASSYNHDISRIRSFLSWLYDMRYVERDYRKLLPGQKMPVPKDPPLWSQEDYEHVKAYMTNRAWCQVHLWLWILGFRTGMVLKDCCYLRWRDVELNDDGPSFLDIDRIKLERNGGSSRCLIPVIPGTDVHEWLLKLKAMEKYNYKRADGITDFVHQDAPGFYHYRNPQLDQDFKAIFGRCGMLKGERRFRHLRHTFCSNLINSGAQFSLICRMTGHQNMSTLLRYMKPDRRSLQDNLAKAFEYSASQSNGHIKLLPSPTDIAT